MNMDVAIMRIKLH